MPRKPPAGAAWAPPPYEPADIGAIQAFSRGEARPDQQTRALKWIVETVCGTYDQSFRPDSERETVFAEGRRFVGLTLVKATKINIAALRGTDGRSRTKRRSDTEQPT